MWAQKFGDLCLSLRQHHEKVQKQETQEQGVDCLIEVLHEPSDQALVWVSNPHSNIFFHHCRDPICIIAVSRALYPAIGFHPISLAMELGNKTMYVVV